jgi:hypothetical protein
MSRRKEAIVAGHRLTAIESGRGASNAQRQRHRDGEKTTSLDWRPATDTAEYDFFTAHEAAFIEAAIDMLIPSDSAGPGALESGVAAFIDRRLATLHHGYGSIDLGRADPRRYGYRLAWSPPALMKAGIADVDGHCLRTRGHIFAGLPRRERTAVLCDVSHGEADLTITQNATFFRLLLQLTVEGYLASPDQGDSEHEWPDRRGSAIARAPSAGDWSFHVSL